MLALLQRQWFLLALVILLFVGIRWPDSAHPAVRWLPGDVIVALVTFIMALPLETSALWQVIRRPGPAWLGAAVNSLAAPPLGWLASRVLPAELAAGVILATTVPCTLASAAVWTRRAGGNEAVAFLVTMITNLACFIVVPTWLVLLIGVRGDLDFGAIVLALLLLVVLPIVLAQLLRQWPPIGVSASRHKELLSFIAQCGVLLMVSIGAIGCGERLAEVENRVAAGDVILMIVAVAVVHLVLLASGFNSARALGIGRPDSIAVAISGSQKTLMIGAFLAPSIGPLAILPMVAYHAAQLVIDTLVADWLRRRGPEDSDGAKPQIEVGG
jgi:sodium/bile acid cotransporter 7